MHSESDIKVNGNTIDKATRSRKWQTNLISTTNAHTCTCIDETCTQLNTIIKMTWVQISHSSMNYRWNVRFFFRQKIQSFCNESIPEKEALKTYDLRPIMHKISVQHLLTGNVPWKKERIEVVATDLFPHRFEIIFMSKCNFVSKKMLNDFDVKRIKSSLIIWW